MSSPSTIGINSGKIPFFSHKKSVVAQWYDIGNAGDGDVGSNLPWTLQIFFNKKPKISSLLRE